MRFDYHHPARRQPAAHARGVVVSASCSSSATTPTVRDAGFAWDRCRRSSPASSPSWRSSSISRPGLLRRGRSVTSFALGFMPFIVLVGLVAGLILMEPDTGTAIVIVLTTVALFFLAGGSTRPRLARWRQRRRRRRRCWSSAAATAATALRLHLRRRRPHRPRLPDPAAADRPGQRRRRGPGPRRQPPEVLLHTRRPHRRHLRDHRRGDRLHRRHRGDRAVRLPRLPRLPRRDEGARRVRLLPRDGHRLLDRLPDADQHRRHHAYDPADRHSVAASSATVAHL